MNFDMKSGDLIAELKELREMVNQSSEHTQRQLQNIDSNLLIGSLISFVLALGISFQLKILIYWIPASFLILFLWSLYIFLSTTKTFTKNLEEIIKVFAEIDKKRLKHVFIWGLKMTSPIATAMSLVYIVTLIALALNINKALTVNQPIYVIILFISALLAALLPIFLSIIIKSFEKEKFFDHFNILIAIKQKKEPKRWYSTLFFLKLATLIVYIPLALVFIMALFITYTTISDLLFLLIVVGLQLIFTVISASYFSSLSVKKELINTLTNFANLDYLINDLILSKDINEDKVEKLKALYLTAKQYDVLVNDLLNFIDIYTLSINSVYLNNEHKLF